jgi:hypothetical protein
MAKVSATATATLIANDITLISVQPGLNRSCAAMIGAQSFAVDSLLAGVAAACGLFAVASSVSALLVFGTGP